MKKDLSTYRKSYDKYELSKAKIGTDPFKAFKTWFEEVDKTFPEIETNAMTVSTVDPDGFPKSRVVLLKEFSDEGFIFYTNYNSEKGRAIAQNNLICISFFWAAAERQVIIRGRAQKVSLAKSEIYFKSRPKGSQLGALVSKQSEIVPNREYLLKSLNALEQEYANQTVPMPNDWGGYLIVPHDFEFWQGRNNRLHDRIRFSNYDGKSWKIDRLSP